MKTKVLIILNLLFFIFSCSREETAKPTPTPPVETDVVTPLNVKTYMVDKNATTETAALFYNLRNLGKTKTVIGQQDAFNSFYQTSEFSDMKKATGNDPGILGSDFMFITDKDNPSNNWFLQQENKIIADTKEAYAKGIINTFSWHLREPYHENSFYTSDMTATEKADAFKSILPGGKFHNWYKTKLDKVAQIVSQLKDSNGTLIPIIFRPFHEFDGNWFWWGASYCTPEEYISAYRFTVEYLRDSKNVHNNPNIDYLTMHIWPKNWTWYDVKDEKNSTQIAIKNTNTYIEEHIQVAQKLNKPLVLEEFGYPREKESLDKKASVANRNLYYQFIFEKMKYSIDHKLPFTALNFWGYGGTGKNNPTNGKWNIGDDFTADPPQEPQGLNSVFSTDKETLQLIKKYNKIFKIK